MRYRLNDANEFGLLFRAPMILAFLEGAKTETRRLLNAPGAAHPEYDYRADEHLMFPYARVGATMFARENVWRDRREPNECVVYAATAEIARYRLRIENAMRNGMVYASKPVAGVFEDDRVPRLDMAREMVKNPNWFLSPCIHMPRWAARVRAPLMRISVERLQAITDEGALAEGIPRSADDATRRGLLDMDAEAWEGTTPRMHYLRLFYMINRKDLKIGRMVNLFDTALADLPNPLVWVLKFGTVTVDTPAKGAR